MGSMDNLFSGLRRQKFQGRSGSSKRRSFQSVRRLATSSAAPRLGDTEASKRFEGPSSNIEDSLLPWTMPCQNSAVASIMRKRQLEGMWSSVLAGSERTLLVKSGGRCSEGSSTRRPGAGGAVWSSTQISANGGRGRAEGPHDDVSHGGGSGQAGLPASIAEPPESTTGRRRARDARWPRTERRCPHPLRSSRDGE